MAGVPEVSSPGSIFLSNEGFEKEMLKVPLFQQRLFLRLFPPCSSYRAVLWVPHPECNEAKYLQEALDMVERENLEVFGRASSASGVSGFLGFSNSPPCLEEVESR